MRPGSKRSRLVASTLVLAIFLIFSSFVGSYLLAANAHAGGFDVIWRVPLTNGFNQMLVASDGSLIVVGDGGLIQDIDRNGTVKWAYDAPHSIDISMGPDGRVYFIDRMLDGNSSVVCLSNNGTPNWRFMTEKVLQDIQIGVDGNIYFVEDPNIEPILLCLTPDGLVSWEYKPTVGDLIFPLAVLPDGNVLLRNIVVNWSNTVRPEGSWVSTVDNLNSISGNGTVLWEKDILALAGNSRIWDGPFIRGNGTVQLMIIVNNTQTAVGLNREGAIIWTIQSDHYTSPGTIGPNNAVYYTEVYEDQPWGYPSHKVSRISSWNTSTGIMNWQRITEASVHGPVAMSDNASLFFLNGELVKLDMNGSIQWSFWPYVITFSPTTVLDNDGDCGVLLAEGPLLTMIDGKGVQLWQYRLDSSVKAGSLGTDGSVVVMTHDFAISIHKPVLTTTMNYFVVLLAIDLFVSLMSAVRIIDMMWPRSKSRID